MSRPNRLPSPLEPLTTTWTFDARGSTPARSSISTTLEPSSLREVKVSLLVVMTVRLLPFTSMVSMSPRAAIVMTSLMGTSLDPPRGSENKVKKMAMTATMINRYMKLFRIHREFIPPPILSRKC